MENILPVETCREGGRDQPVIMSRSKVVIGTVIQSSHFKMSIFGTKSSREKHLAYNQRLGAGHPYTARRATGNTSRPKWRHTFTQWSEATRIEKALIFLEDIQRLYGRVQSTQKPTWFWSLKKRSTLTPGEPIIWFPHTQLVFSAQKLEYIQWKIPNKHAC